MNALASTSAGNNVVAHAQSLAGAAPWWVRYGFGAMTAVAAALIREAFEPVLEDSLQYSFSYPAVLVVGLYAGLGPGLVCMTIAAAATAYLRGTPAVGLHWLDKDELTALAIFVALALMILALASAQRRARMRITAASKKANAEAERLQNEIAERLRAEAALRRSESGLARAQRIAHLGSWELDLSTKRMTWSHEAHQILGIDPESAHPAIETFLHAIHPEDRDQVVGALNDSMHGGPPIDIEFRIIQSGGKHRYVNLQTELFSNPGDQGSILLGTILDITERHQVEEDLRTSETRTRMIVDSALDAVVLMDARGQITGWNAQAERLFGWRRDEALGMQFVEAIIPKAARHAHKNDMRRFLTTGQGRMIGRRVEITARDKAGREFPVEMSMSPVELRNTLIFSAFLRDIAERKKSEEALRFSNEMQKLLLSELNHRVRNNLAGLISLIDMSASTAKDIPTLASTISNRVHSMAAVHSMLSHTSWGALSMDEMVNRLVPHGRRGNLRTEGPSVQIPAHQCTAFGMVIGELMANSLKYGALSASQGVVEVKWSADESADQSTMRVQMQWFEHGGPPIDREPQPQLGTSLIKGFMKSDLRGEAKLSYSTQGASHHFDMTFDYSHHPTLGDSK